jgi:ribonuclease Y
LKVNGLKGGGFNLLKVNLDIMDLLLFGLLLAVGILIGFYLRKKYAETKVGMAENLAQKILEAAKKDAEAVKKEAKLQAKDDLYRSKADLEKETRERRSELHNLEKRLIQKEESLDKKLDLLDQKETVLSKKEKALDNQEKSLIEKEKRYNHLLEEQKVMLEKISGMSSDEAKKILMQSMENEARHEAAKSIRRIEEETKEKADKMAKNILSLAIQRYAADYIAESTVSVVNLHNDRS